MARTKPKSAQCPVARALDAIGDEWSLLIIRDAFDGIRRFSEFQKSLGIAKGMLTTRLRKLVALGIFELVPASDGSAYCEYVLTDKGHGLFHVVVSLRQWGEGYLFALSEARSRLIDMQRREPVATLELRSKSGRLLAWSDTMVDKVARTEKPKPPRRGAKKLASG